MNITFKQLSVFVAIVRSGSMTLAAETLFMTKGAISQTLAELESQLGVRLFDRQHARLYINHEGQKLLPVADELLSRMQGLNNYSERIAKIPSSRWDVLRLSAAIFCLTC